MRGKPIAKQMDDLAIYCADVGSVKAGNFGWARLEPSSGDRTGGVEIADLVAALIDDLRAGRPAALGFECPLFVPLAHEVSEIGSQRPGEGNRSWLAAGGAGALAVGVAEAPWILTKVRNECAEAQAYVDWRKFRAARSGLFVWEAFVTGQAKAATHEGDALIAVEAFAAALPNPEQHNAVRCETPIFSLIGATLLRTGWLNDLAALSEPCLVIKAVASSERGAETS